MTCCSEVFKLTKNACYSSEDELCSVKAHLSLRKLHLLNGIPEAPEGAPLYKLQLCRSALIKHAPERN